MNVLLIGGNGFIGSHIIDILLYNRHNVRVLDYSHEKYREPLSNVDYRISSLNNINELTESLIGIDVVFHLACTIVPSTSNLDCSSDIKNNILPTLKLLDTMLKSDINRIVFFSSGGAVYGNPKLIPTPEEYALNPISSYGIIKSITEYYLKLYEKLFGLNVLIIRPSNPYGPRQGHLMTQGVISTFLNNIKKKIDLTIFGDGNAIKDYIYISDLVEACYSLVIKKESGIFNIGSGVGTSVNSLIQAIKKMFSYVFSIKYIESKNFDVQKSILDTRKIKNAIKWTPKVSLEQGIKKHWDWIDRRNICL